MLQPFIKNLVAAICSLCLWCGLCPITKQELQQPEPNLGGLIHNTQEVFTEGVVLDGPTRVTDTFDVTGTSTLATTTVASITATNATLNSLTVSSCSGCGGGEGGSYSGQTFVASTTYSVDFGTLATVNCDAGSVTATGTVEGDFVHMGIPNSFYAWNGYHYEGWVSATDTVAIKRCNNRQATGSDLAPGVIRIEVRR